MRALIFLCLSWLLGGTLVFAQSGTRPLSALAALKQLPRGEGKRLARIEGREGTPVPSRWYLIVFDPKQESGVREYVIAGGEIVASRTVSQFAENLRETDVIGASALKIDSERAGRIAQDYALANNAAVASLDFELHKEGPEAAPLWNVTCLDESGKTLGQVSVTAGRGTVVAHEGFAIVPANAKPPDRDRPHTQATPQVASNGPDPDDSGNLRGTRKDVFHRIGGSLQKLFTGHDTIGH